MSIFEKIKQSLNLKEVAEFYGLEINRSGFVSCLFHDDKTPSMKLYDHHFYCFGCQKCGDVISLVAQLHDVSQYDSAKIIMRDFNLDVSNDDYLVRNTKSKIAKNKQKEQDLEKENETRVMLKQYLAYMQHFKALYSPKNDNEAVHELFIQSLHSISTIEYYLDVLTFEPLETRKAFLNEYVNQLDKIKMGVKKYKRAYPHRKEI